MLADEIARAVSDVPVSASFDEPTTAVPWSRLPSGVAKIAIHASVDGEERLWTADGGGWLTSVEPQHIDAVIQRKIKTITLAKSRCSDLWLTIVNDQFSKAAPAELSTIAAHQRYEHPFDRLLWLEPHEPRVWELG